MRTVANRIRIVCRLIRLGALRAVDPKRRSVPSDPLVQDPLVSEAKTSSKNAIEPANGFLSVRSWTELSIPTSPAASHYAVGFSTQPSQYPSAATLAPRKSVHGPQLPSSAVKNVQFAQFSDAFGERST